MDASCQNCQMFTVCKLRLDSDQSLKGFIDWDKPGGSTWLGSFWKLLAERCIHFVSKSNET